MKSIAFLILNYNTSNELFRCIHSIQCYCKDYVCVVVDNGSNCDDLVKTKKICKETGSILLISEKNVGFAKGNNIGFRYIRNNIECKYIAMINSDTLLTSDDFFIKLEKAYEEYGFAVLGPDILPYHSNPMVDEPDSKEKVLSQIKKTKNKIRIMKIPGFNILYLLLNKIRFMHSTKKSSILSKPLINCELHGCFWVFSNLYTLDGLCDETFLYGEEDLLAKACRDNNLKLLYYPQLKVIHNESVATKKSIPNLIERKLFFLENRLDSYYILLKQYEGNDMR